MLLFKPKTEYEVRISDWSSDGGSSDRLARWPVVLRDFGRQGRLVNDRGRFDEPGDDEILRLVGNEVVQPVLDDRAANADAILFGDLLGLLAGVLLVGRRIPPAVGGPIPEEAAAEVVGPRLRDRRNGRAADLVVLGLVVG